MRTFVLENWRLLSSDAKSKWQIYERLVYDARAEGRRGLTVAE
jgi:hypothetical protein